MFVRTRRRLALVVVGLLALGVALGAWGVNWVRTSPLAEARRAFERGEFLSAAQLAEARILNGDLADQKAMLLAARSYAQIGRWPQAEAYFAQVSLKQQDDLRLRARGLEIRGLWSEAALVYEQIVQRWPRDGEALQHLAAIRSQQDRDEEALVLARRLARIPSHQLNGHIISGFIEHQMRNYSRGAEHFLEALKIAPDLKGIPNDPGLILQCLAEDLLLIGKGEEAEKYALRAKELTAAPEPCLYLGRARLLRGDHDGARAAWEEAIARDPKYVPALQDLGQAYLQQGELKKALRCFQTAREIEPNNEAVKYALDTTYRYLGQRPDAEEKEQ